MTPTNLDIEALERRHPGLTEYTAGSLYEAALVCLNRHHASPTEFRVESNSFEREVCLTWSKPPLVTMRAHANEIDATELGACGVSLAAVELCRGLVTYGRAHTGTGADYYVGPPGQQDDYLENCYRLEVSGSDRGTLSECHRRLGAKIEQTKRPGLPQPAIAAVVGFRQQIVLICDSR